MGSAYGYTGTPVHSEQTAREKAKQGGHDAMESVYERREGGESGSGRGKSKAQRGYSGVFGAFVSARSREAVEGSDSGTLVRALARAPALPRCLALWCSLFYPSLGCDVETFCWD